MRHRATSCRTPSGPSDARALVLLDLLVALLLDAITVRLDSSTVLDGLTLRVENGESVALLGPSGSGKTTVLRTIAGLETPAHGDVMFDGKQMNDVPPAKRNLAMVFQDNVLFPKMDVRGNVGFPLSVRRKPRREIASRVEAETRAAGIANLLKGHPRQLSAGEQQVVQLARAMVRRPDILLVDEPFARLDHVGSGRLRGELRLVQAGYGVTAVYATHSHVDAMGLADRVAVIHSGRIRQVGPPNELYAEPSDMFVASFMGEPEMAYLEPVISGSTAQLGQVDLPVPEPVPRQTLIGVRPEHWRICDRGLPAEVVRSYRIGPDTYAECATGSGNLTVRLREAGQGRGDRFDLWPLRYHVFDAGSGLATFHGEATPP